MNLDLAVGGSTPLRYSKAGEELVVIITRMIPLIGLACTAGPTSAPPPIADAGLVLDASALPDAGSMLDAGTSPLCGDGVVNDGEFCDDGNLSEADECANDCTPAAPFHAYDAVLSELLSTWDIAGATVAVTKDERLVLRRAYGFADRAEQRVMRRDDRMRIASLSKPITAVAILGLVEQGRLALDDRAFTLLDDLEPPPGRSKDPRLATITIAHLLRHEGGWDRNESGDPMFWSRRICQELGIPGPATAQDTLYYMLGQPLDFDPGTDYAYSNFGYSILGRVIEQVTGMTYESYLRDEVLAPMGIQGMELGRTHPQDRPADEVAYHMYDGAYDVVSVFPEVTDRVPRPSGGWHQEALDAHGGWISSASDLIRFVTASDGRPGRADFLSAQSTALMTQKPELSRWLNRTVYYAMGWSVRPIEGDATWWHNGALPGTSTLFLRGWHGYNWVVLTNSRPEDGPGFLTALDQAMWRAFETVQAWPEYDLFD